jgi:para-nitrobenzyl esterase
VRGIDPYRDGRSTRRPVLVRCTAGSLAGEAVEAVAGEAVDGLACERFLGIPYAAPPIGDNRFQPARPHAGWDGVFDATRFGAASAQVFDPQEAVFAELDDGPLRNWAGSEDSLTLNIWRPSAPAAACPVMVWIHGGANWLESSRLPAYDGSIFAAAGVVFVSFNYRLGVFGFLDLSPIGGPHAAHSNGLTDQLLAIDWICANIAAFGGDPANITLVGESAGAMDISWLLAAGRLPAGIRRLMLMSGVASVVGLGWDGERSAHDPAEGRRRAAGFLDALGYATIAQLNAASTGAILDRHAAVAAQASILLDMDTLFYPRVGAVAAVDPFTAAHRGAGRGLEVMLGFTAYEMGLWLLWDDDLDRRPPGWAAAAIPYLPEAARGELVRRYRGWLPDEAESRLGMHMLGDAMFAMPSMWMADLLADSGAAVHCYRFDWEAGARAGALHAADQAFLFGNADTLVGEPLVGRAAGPSAAARRATVQQDMFEAVIAFVRGGDPATDAAPWPRWTTRSRAMRLFGGATMIADDPWATRRQWWTANVLPARLGGGA